MGKTVPVKDLDEDFKHGQQDEGWEKMKTARKAKRSRHMYSPENAESQEGSLKPASTDCDSSASNSKDHPYEPSSAVQSYHNKKTVNDKDHSRDHLVLEVESNCSFLDNKDVMEIVLVDVQLSVNASPGAENAPFVSLTSEAYGIAVIGYPLDVGEVRDESAACKMFGGRGKGFDQLVWRTSKRSPVCYVTSSPCASRQAGKNVKDAMLPAANRKEKSLMKLLKNPKKFNQGEKASNKTCVPVQLIFSKILAAVES